MTDIENELRQQLIDKIREALIEGTGLILLPHEVSMINIKSTQRHYHRYLDHDSPKGENIPGVRYRGVAA